MEQPLRYIIRAVDNTFPFGHPKVCYFTHVAWTGFAFVDKRKNATIYKTKRTAEIHLNEAKWMIKNMPLFSSLRNASIIEIK